jgi:hypothetical protein
MTTAMIFIKEITGTASENRLLKKKIVEGIFTGLCSAL